MFVIINQKLAMWCMQPKLGIGGKHQVHQVLVKFDR